MQFRVPQFIDIEDKIIGPLTLKQFGYVLGAGGFAFIFWTFIPIKIIAIVLILIVSSLFLALAFLKINNRSFGDILESAFAYYTGAKIYTWKQPKERKQEATQTQETVTETNRALGAVQVDGGKLHSLSLGLDVYDRNPQNDDNL